jgi:tetratricopeptide (TPR) repeat protein
MPRSATDLRLEGNARLDKGELASAESCYRQAVALDAADPMALISLAFVLNEQQHPREARSYALKATVLAADSVDAFYVLATAQDQERDWPAATLSLRRVLQLNPDFEPAYGMLCRVLAEQGLLDDARAVIIAKPCGSIRSLRSRTPTWASPCTNRESFRLPPAAFGEPSCWNPSGSNFAASCCS